MDRVESEDRAPLAVEVQHEPNGPVLRLTGELDLSSIGVLQEALDPLLEGKPPRLVFDLGALRFMDSSGLAEVLRTATATSVELRNPSKIVRRVIELTGVSGILPIQP